MTLIFSTSSLWASLRQELQLQQQVPQARLLVLLLAQRRKALQQQVVPDQPLQPQRVQAPQAPAHLL